MHVVMGGLRRLRAASAAILLAPVLVLTAVLGLTAAPATAAIQIFYQVEDRPDNDPARDLWRYTYAVTGHAFAESEGFTLYFEADSTGEMELVSYPGPWLAEVFNPDATLSLPGLLVAQSTALLPVGPWQFSVDFVRLGEGSPGSQRYELFDANFAVLDPPGTLGTVPIPEPHVNVLLLIGFALLAAISRSRRNR